MCGAYLCLPLYLILNCKLVYTLVWISDLIQYRLSRAAALIMRKSVQFGSIPFFSTEIKSCRYNHKILFT